MGQNRALLGIEDALVQCPYGIVVLTHFRRCCEIDAADGNISSLCKLNPTTTCIRISVSIICRGLSNNTYLKLLEHSPTATDRFEDR